MLRSTDLGKLAPLFHGYESGSYTLPAVITAGYNGVKILAAQPAFTPQRPVTLDVLIDGFTDAAGRGADMPDVTPLLDAERDDRLAALHAEVNTQAHARLADDVVSMVAGGAEQIIVEHLRPALEQTVTSLRGSVNVFAAHGNDPANLLRAPEKARKAWLSVDGDVARYGTIRTAASILHRAGATPVHDVNGYFAEIRNLPQVMTGARQGAGYGPVAHTQWQQQWAVGWRPWPIDDAKARLVWLLTHDAELWLPTAAEQDAAWMDVFGDRHRALQAGATQIRQAREAFAGVGPTGGDAA